MSVASLKQCSLIIDRNHYLYSLMLKKVNKSLIKKKRKYIHIFSVKQEEWEKGEKEKTNNYLQLLSFITCIYSYYPNVMLLSRVIPTMLSLCGLNKVISTFHSKGPNNSQQRLPNLANKYLLYGNFEWNKPL